MTETLPFLDEQPLSRNTAAGSAAVRDGQDAVTLDRKPRTVGGWRLAVVSAGLAIAMLGVAGKLLVTAAPGTISSANAANSAQRALAVRVTPPAEERASLPRAKIYDRNGELLAYSLPMKSLYAHPEEVPDPEQAAALLVKAFPELDQKKLAARLSSDKEFVYVAQHVTPEQHMAALELGVPGIRVKEEYRRVYPKGPLAVHVVGLTRADHTALSGVEAFVDPSLVLDPDESLYLSLDMRLQQRVRKEVQTQIDEFEAIGGVGVVLDVNTGEMLASVSLPDFDPNIFGKRETRLERNQVSNGVYELGSVFKPIAAAVALDTQVAQPSSMFDASRPLYVDGFTIRDFHAKNRWLSMQEVLTYSSNIGAARIAAMVGTDRLVSYFRDFGFFSVPTMGVPEVQAPLLPATWQDLSAMTASFGHGMAVSPAQFVAAFAALVNGGKLYEPTYMRYNEAGFAPARQVIKPETSKIIRTMLRGVVENGSGQGADSRFYPVGGKTGTAEKPEKGKGGYSKNKRISSFIGAFPINEPRYVVFVMIDEPKVQRALGPNATGGRVAAPAVGRIIDSIAPMLGVKPQQVLPTDGEPGSGRNGRLMAAAMQVRN